MSDTTLHSIMKKEQDWSYLQKDSILFLKFTFLGSKV